MSHQDKVTATVHKHIAELRELAARRVITEEDHDVIGLILSHHIGRFIDLTSEAWKKFVQIIEESRKVHYESVEM